MSIPVESKQVNKFIVSVEINIYKVVLNVGLNAIVYAFDSDNKQVDAFDILIIGDEYNNWQNDDELELLILSKCGLIPLVNAQQDDIVITD